MSVDCKAESYFLLVKLPQHLPPVQETPLRCSFCDWFRVDRMCGGVQTRKCFALSTE
jgi:hypothetical protein